MNNFLKSLCQRILSLPVCNKKDLSQIFDKNNNPIDKNLKMTTYKDESKFQWSISIRLISTDKCIVVMIKPSSSIKEKKCNHYHMLIECISKAVYDAL